VAGAGAGGGTPLGKGFCGAGSGFWAGAVGNSEGTSWLPCCAPGGVSSGGGAGVGALAAPDGADAAANAANTPEARCEMGVAGRSNLTMALLRMGSVCMRTVDVTVIGIAPNCKMAYARGFCAQTPALCSPKRDCTISGPARGTCLLRGMPHVMRTFSRLASCNDWPLALVAGSALHVAEALALVWC
jgi:hypothetical protein